MNKTKGFTLIELIVVIAIIAILAAIVLVNVTQYINKSKDSAIKANMGTIYTQASAYIADNQGTFTQAALRADTTIAAAVDAANTQSAGTSDVMSDGTNWCFQTPLKSDTTNSPWCVDDTGYAGVVTTGSCDGAADAHGFICQ